MNEFNNARIRNYFQYLRKAKSNDDKYYYYYRLDATLDTLLFEGIISPSCYTKLTRKASEIMWGTGNGK